MPAPETQADFQNLSMYRPLHVRAAHKIEDFVDNINWLHVAFKCCAFTYIGLIAWITWQVLPINGHWDVGRQSDSIPQASLDLINYFGTFNGHAECHTDALQLYSAPPRDDYGHYAHNAFCPTRQNLLRSMSNGGRIGFDAPYIPKGCHYRWFTVAEICMILERFDGIVFVGDISLQSIYNGFNIILRQDLVHGALQTWAMTSDEKKDCKCENQFTRTNCAKHFVTTSSQVSKSIAQADGQVRDGYYCQTVSHSFLRVDGGKPSQSTSEGFSQTIPKSPRSHYKPVPIIHSLAPMTASHGQAATSLLDFANLADLAERKAPMLWIGPTAAGHVEIKGRKTNQEIWDFDEFMAKAANDNGIDVLRMWNMTVQASSWDGVRFGKDVALVQAMMVINWLSRLESS